jgi:hypothetical protein
MNRRQKDLVSSFRVSTYYLFFGKRTCDNIETEISFGSLSSFWGRNTAEK